MDELPPGFLSLRVAVAPAPVPTPPPPPQRSPRTLADGIVVEMLLRVPPDDPARLLHAALVCKRWARLLADRGFRCRYRERHGGAPPLLGLLGNLEDTGGSVRFAPTLAFSPARASRREYRAHDARHGRVLLNRLTWDARMAQHQQHDDALAVWDPVTDEHRPLPLLQRPRLVKSWNAALLCNATGCDHPDCRPGHFRVVFVGIDTKRMFAHVYSSESAAWGRGTSALLPGYDLDEAMPGALAGGALYFAFRKGDNMLKYDLATHKIYLVSLPNRPYDRRLMAMEDGGVGFAEVDAQFTLNLWSVVDPEGDAAQWAVSRSIDLRTQLPAPALWSAPRVVAIADVVGVIFLQTNDGLYAFDLKTGQGQGICVMTDGFYDIVPYVSFYTPVLRVGSR